MTLVEVKLDVGNSANISCIRRYLLLCGIAHLTRAAYSKGTEGRICAIRSWASKVKRRSDTKARRNHSTLQLERGILCYTSHVQSTDITIKKSKYNKLTNRIRYSVVSGDGGVAIVDFRNFD
jgi:hypothetical protein